MYALRIVGNALKVILKKQGLFLLDHEIGLGEVEKQTIISLMSHEPEIYKINMCMRHNYFLF